MGRYSGLVAISIVLRIVGTLGLVIGFILVVVALAPQPTGQANPYDPSGSVATLIKIGGAASLLLSGLIFLAFGQVIQVFVDTANNSWKLVELMQEANAQPAGQVIDSKFTNMQSEFSVEAVRVLKEARSRGYAVRFDPGGKFVSVGNEKGETDLSSNADIVKWGRANSIT